MALAAARQEGSGCMLAQGRERSGLLQVPDAQAVGTSARREGHGLVPRGSYGHPGPQDQDGSRIERWSQSGAGFLSALYFRYVSRSMSCKVFRKVLRVKGRPQKRPGES